MTTDWMDNSVCSEIGGEVFFDTANGDTATAKMAKRACGMCSVRNECLEWVLSFTDDEDAYEETDGVYGGTTRAERRTIMEHRAAGVVLTASEYAESGGVNAVARAVATAIRAA